MDDLIEFMCVLLMRGVLRRLVERNGWQCRVVGTKLGRFESREGIQSGDLIGLDRDEYFGARALRLWSERIVGFAR